jgi:rare lipoprotein A
MRRFVLIFCVAVLLAGCGRKKARVGATPRAPVPRSGGVAVPAGSTERGMASWYGHPYHGRPAADGEIYDMEQLVAAHRTLPFQTMVRVENLGNGKSIDVRIIDRGPFAAGRIIDLSHAAAGAIDLIGPGVGQVEVTVLSMPAALAPAMFGVQVGAFQERANADRMKERMTAAYGSAREVVRSGDPPLRRVLVGEAASPEAAETLARRIRQEQNVREAFVVRIDGP